MNLEKLSTKELLAMLHEMNERLKFLEGVEAVRKKRERSRWRRAAVSSDKYQISPRCTPNRNKQ